MLDSMEVSIKRFSRKVIQMLKSDTQLWAAIQNESIRQEHHLELIASENYAPTEVMRLQGTLLTNKYAEGYPGRRYYGGCEFVDQIEQIAIDRAKHVFKCNYANVQPHSGSNANAAVYLALMNAGDTIMGLDLSHGGHLTHGSPVNFSGKSYKSVSYQLDEKGYLNFDHIRDQALLHQPKVIVAGFSAYPRKIDWKKFREIADEIGAYLIADMAHISGLVAAGLHDSPLPYAHVVTSTTHKTLRGPRGGLILSNDESLFKKLDSAVFPGSQGGPLIHVIAAKALCFQLASTLEFKEYQQQVLLNAVALAETLMVNGLEIVSGGTDNHLMLLSLLNKPLTGKEAEIILGKANITVNKNTVPGENRSPLITSGVRLGTPALTTRGMKQPQMQLVGKLISNILLNPSEDMIEKVKKDVIALCSEFPVYHTEDLV